MQGLKIEIWPAPIFVPEVDGVTFSYSDFASVSKWLIRVRLLFEFENPTPVQTPATIIHPAVIYPCFYLRNDRTDPCYCRNRKVTPVPGLVFRKFLTPGPEQGLKEKRRILPDSSPVTRIRSHLCFMQPGGPPVVQPLASVKHYPVAGLRSNRIVQFTTGSGFSNKLYRIRYGYPNCVDDCRRMFNQKGIPDINRIGSNIWTILPELDRTGLHNENIGLD